MQRKLTFLAWFFILSKIGSTSCIAQQRDPSGQFIFVHYTPKDGLINSRVKKAYQDSKGRMYFLTFGGFSVYDGARFKNYSSKEGLATDVVNDILEVGNDSLFVSANSDHYLNVLVNGKIKVLKTEGDSCGIVNQFYRHDNGKLYLSSDNGLFLLENKRIKKLNVSYLSKTSPELPYLGSITGVNNFLLITTHELRERKGLYLYDIKNDRICDALPSTEVYLFGRDKNKRIWIGVSEELFILDPVAFAKGKLRLLPATLDVSSPAENPATKFAFDKGSMWSILAKNNDSNKELIIFDGSAVQFRMFLPEQTAASNIRNVTIDGEKTIWLCNDGEGVFKIVNASMQIFENPFGVARDNHSNIAYCTNDISWHGTSSTKLFRRTGKNLQKFNCNITPSPSIFLEKNEVLFAKDNQHIYQAHFRETSKFIQFKKLISLSGDDNFTKQVLIDPAGTIIASQKSGLGIWKNNQLLEHIPIYRADNIEELAIDKKGLLWVVKRYTGIDVYQLQPSVPSKYLRSVFHFAEQKIAGSPRCFLFDKKGLIWIGTREHGIACYEQQGEVLHELFHFDVGNGLTDNFVTTIACDSANNIIVGTQTGLDRLLYFSNSYRAENLSKSCNFFALINQAWADKNQAYALTNSGILLQLSTPIQQNRTFNSNLLLEEIKVNAQTTSTGKQKFTHKENNISFLVAAPSFLDEKQVSYSYLLEGSGNKQWSDTSTTNAAINLTNLSAGKYLLKVKAFFPSTYYDAVDLTYPFEILPPWWQTWWFRGIAALMLVGIFITGFRFYYSRKLEKQKLILEKQQAIEKERTRIATDMHDDIGAGLSRIKFLSQSLLNKNTEGEIIKPDLEKITAYSDEMSEKMGEIIWALNERNDTIADLVAYTRSYTAEYLQYHNIKCEANTPLHLPGTFITGEMRRNIFLSVKECLHNIVKHAQATKVIFSIQLNGGMQIVIHDNGNGIDWDHQRAFSNGIQNIKSRMKEINGEVVFSNERGTKVSMTIPIL